MQFSIKGTLALVLSSFYLASTNTPFFQAILLCLAIHTSMAFTTTGRGAYNKHARDLSSRTDEWFTLQCDSASRTDYCKAAPRQYFCDSSKSLNVESDWEEGLI